MAKNEEGTNKACSCRHTLDRPIHNKCSPKQKANRYMELICVIKLLCVNYATVSEALDPPPPPPGASLLRLPENSWWCQLRSALTQCKTETITPENPLREIKWSKRRFIHKSPQCMHSWLVPATSSLHPGYLEGSETRFCTVYTVPGLRTLPKENNALT